MSMDPAAVKRDRSCERISSWNLILKIFILLEGFIEGKESNEIYTICARSVEWEPYN